MRTYLLVIISIFSLLGCDQRFDSEQSDVFIQRTEDYTIYCSEDYMADVNSWKINFKNERAFIEDASLFLDDPQFIPESELLEVTNLNSGLPFGQYQAVSDEGTKVLIEIVGVKPSASSLEGVVFFFGSTLVEGNENLITCVGDLP